MTMINGAGGMRDCPVIGCQELRHGHHLVCSGHWKALPEEAKRKVTLARTAYRDAGDAEKKKAAYDTWFAAATEAISYLSNQPAEAV